MIIYQENCDMKSQHNNDLTRYYVHVTLKYMTTGQHHNAMVHDKSGDWSDGRGLHSCFVEKALTHMKDWYFI